MVYFIFIQMVLFHEFHSRLEGKWTIIFIESNIGVRCFNPVQIIRWWTDTDSSMNGNIYIMKFITDIQNTVTEYIHSRDSNVDSE